MYKISQSYEALSTKSTQIKLQELDLKSMQEDFQRIINEPLYFFEASGFQ